MLMIANVLALAFVVADEPKTPTAPRPAGSSADSEEVCLYIVDGVRGFFMGAAFIPIGSFEPDAPKPGLPKMTRPSLGGNAPEAVELWHLTLPDAIRIGLDNSEVIRVIRLGPPDSGPTTPDNVSVRFANAGLLGGGVVIAPLSRDASIWKFKAEVMAHVRTIEQQYWALSERQVALWGRETAVKLGEEILNREKAEQKAGRATTADIAEAEQQLENSKLNLVTATSDLITTERQLRNILGLPSADNRRIVPDTAPTEARLEPEWEAALATMLGSQPDIALQRQLVGVAEFKAVLEGENPALPPDQREESKRRLEKQQAFLQQVIHQTTHSLARFFLEVDSHYKQYQAARKLRSAAQDRLTAQRAFYEEGRITVDRLLDAVGQYANAVAQEAQFRSGYNTSIAALEEAKGTLLTHDGITVADAASSRKAYVQARDDRVARAAFQEPAPASAPVSTPTPAPPAATTYKLRAKLGGIRVWEIELEINQAPPAGPAR